MIYGHSLWAHFAWNHCFQHKLSVLCITFIELQTTHSDNYTSCDFVIETSFIRFLQIDQQKMALEYPFGTFNSRNTFNLIEDNWDLSRIKQSTCEFHYVKIFMYRISDGKKCYILFLTDNTCMNISIVEMWFCFFINFYWIKCWFKTFQWISFGYLKKKNISRETV